MHIWLKVVESWGFYSWWKIISPMEGYFYLTGVVLLNLFYVGPRSFKIKILEGGNTNYKACFVVCIEVNNVPFTSILSPLLNCTAHHRIWVSIFLDKLCFDSGFVTWKAVIRGVKTDFTFSFFSSFFLCVLSRLVVAFLLDVFSTMPIDWI